MEMSSIFFVHIKEVKNYIYKKDKERKTKQQRLFPDELSQLLRSVLGKLFGK